MSKVKKSKREKRERESEILADWMIDNDSTLKQLSKEFLIPTTTIFRRLTITLRDVDFDKWHRCQAIMKTHKRLSLPRARKILFQTRQKNKSISN